ncbi:MAG: archaeoflavoprotein AfpA [Deltaproteobacteria bacterium]|nr:archaeoflavoprotein AfpA [Deltaproteobacteria bacterium]
MPVNIAWGITGAGDQLNEVFDIMDELSRHDDFKITAIVSKAGESVLKWYKLTERLNTISEKVLIEKDANTPFIIGPLQTGKYQYLIVAPATANTVAKLVHGIADTLITNCVAMVNKAGKEVYVLPVDRERGTITTTLPDGKPFQLTIRDIDVDNSERLRSMSGITVIDNPAEIKRVIKG